MDKYSWNFSLRWVTEFVRKDAEIVLDIDGVRSQKVIKRGCATTAEAEKVAVEFTQQLATKIAALIERETAALKTAKE